MNTNKIKSFAKEARLIIMDGVLQRLKYWGFSENGTNDQKLEATQGGYIFRGQIFTNTSVPSKWNTLKNRLTNKQAVLDIVEQAAYTWFNRLMAIKVLEENGYLEPTLEFAKGMRTPLIVQNAKKGIHSLRSQADKDLLLEYLQEDKEEEAFGLLITDLCNRNNLLHAIFGKIDDYTEILLPQNLLQKDGVLDLINSDAIAEEDYKEVELIGWLYQFYISDKKDEVFAGFKKNKKARAEDIPAATQIFTPKWIVKYMVENTVGKIYLDYEPTSSLKEGMKYLVQNDSDKENKAIISDITELTLIDPASGSGHILVTGFELLFKMYREAGYTAKQAVDSILEHNLFGLDIDDRAMQLARFAVLLKAAQLLEKSAKGIGKDFMQSPNIIPSIYSFPEASHFTSEELQIFLGHDGHQFTAELKEALQLLNQGKNIGSALKLELSEDSQNHIRKQYQDWLQLCKRAGLDIEQSSIWYRLHPFLDVLLVLSKKYASVVANPPYMGQKSMNGELKDYVNTQYPLTKSDLFAVFIEVCVKLSSSLGFNGIINQHSWMFLKRSYEQFRINFFEELKILSLLHLGTRVFEELNGEVVQSTAFIFQNFKDVNFIPVFYRLVDYKTNKDKKEAFLKGYCKYQRWCQFDFGRIPNNSIGYWISDDTMNLFDEKQFLESELNCRVGLDSGNNNEFIRLWFEINDRSIHYNPINNQSFSDEKRWALHTKGGEFKKWYGNLESVLKFDPVNYERLLNAGNHLPSRQFYFLEGLNWSRVGGGKFGVRYAPKGMVFNSSCPTGFSTRNEWFLGFLNTKVTRNFIDIINPTLNFQVGTINKIPLKKESSKEEQVIKNVDQNVSISKKDWDSRETSWDFEKSPLLMVNGELLMVNGGKNSSLSHSYQLWQEQVTKDFFQLHANEEVLNRIFIDIYGLQEELTPEVALKDITILQEELNGKDLEALEPVFREQGAAAVSLPINKAEVISQFLSYGIGVFLGRYRLDKPGLNIAHPNPSEEELAAYKYNGHTISIDEDAIVPLMGEDCNFPDDVLVRTKDLVHAIWGEESLTENINFIHDALGMDLHKWLTEKFWGYHTSMYKKKPIYWLFSSNVKKPQNAAFKVLVYMHRMDKYTVQKIQRNYLHPHQEYIKYEIKKLSDNEENLSKQELKRLEQLRNHELECRDYNEVLKDFANQQIEFDLDDGVSVNYEKFEGAVAKI